MYERNAIVIDRYFSNVYGYDRSSNIKNNSSNYFELVDAIEKYQEASETENSIMAEFEKIANQIKETKKIQEILNKKNRKYNENRERLFENLDEDSVILAKQFQKVQEEINKNNDDINENADRFVEEIKEFNEKSEVRSNIGKERRIVENDYRKQLKITTDNFNNISIDKLKEIKAFIKSEDKSNVKEQIRERVLKNGAKEKIPFDENVINTAIDVSLDIEEKRAEVLMSLYDKTFKILEEIKKDTIRVDKHKKIITDSKSKLDFLSVISEYIILFLDNERMNCIGGKDEHEKNMKEACDNLQSDLIQIKNMYTLLIKEIGGKATKKAYTDLYNLEYLMNLQEEQRKFEKDISKLNMIGTVIYPDYWRVEGMKKIYDTFKHILTEIYGKDLTEYEPLDITFDVNEEILDEDEEDIKIEESVNDIKFIKEEKFDDVEENDKSSEEPVERFQWEDDDEDEDEEVNDDEKLEFDNTYIFDQEEEEEIEEEQEKQNIIEDDEYEDEDELKRDEEIDKILGIFDDDNENEEDEDLSESSIDENDDLEHEIFDNVEEEMEEKKKEKNKPKHAKKKSLFGRNK